MKRAFCVVVAMALASTVVSAQDAKQAEAGKKLFTSKQCTKCHRIAGVGAKAGGKLDGVASKVSAEDMRRWLTEPAEMEKSLDHKPKLKMSSKMTQLALKETDIAALITYLQTLK